MGLFKRKYDREKDKLELKLDINEGEYNYYFNGKKLEYVCLNKKTRAYLDKQNHILEINPEFLKAEKTLYERNIRTIKLKEAGIYLKSSFEYLGTPNGTMSADVSNLLEGLVVDNDKLIGINRTRFSYHDVKTTLEKGLELTGHLGSGVISDEIDIQDNISFYPDNRTIIKEAMTCHAYKNSTGSFIVAIPIDKFNSPDILINDNGVIKFNPRYIVAYLPWKEGNVLDEIVYSPYYKANSFSFNPNEEISRCYSEEKKSREIK